MQYSTTGRGLSLDAPQRAALAVVPEARPGHEIDACLDGARHLLPSRHANTTRQAQSSHRCNDTCRAIIAISGTTLTSPSFLKWTTELHHGDCDGAATSDSGWRTAATASTVYERCVSNIQRRHTLPHPITAPSQLDAFAAIRSAGTILETFR